MKIKFLILMTMLLTGCLSSTVDQKESWQSMLDIDLGGWDTYLSYRHQLGYDGSQPSDEGGKALAPIGENTELGDEVFSVSLEDGNPVLRVSGEAYGSLVSKQAYRNYHLKLKVRWGEKKWPPRERLLKDTGIIYHSVGKLGTDYWRTWMLGQEFQIMQGHMGDYWSQQTSAMDVRAFMPEYIMNPVASLTQPFLSVGHDQDIKGLVIRSDNHESAPGEWTQLDLITHEGRSLHIVNGEVVMVLKNSRYQTDEGFVPLREGKIQLQSEAAEVFFSDIKLREISTLPKRYQNLF